MRAALLLALAGCATTVRPPADPRDPVVVVLVDYGKHSSLILPSGAGWVEFAYGEWDYFALNEDDLCTGMAALCCFNQGTLGRRNLTAPRVHAEELFELRVSRADADALRSRLEERYGRHPETRLHNSLNGLTFVHDDESYICWNNCNHVVARWLEELGCKVGGCGCFADFRILAPDPGPK